MSRVRYSVARSADVKLEKAPVSFWSRHAAQRQIEEEVVDARLSIRLRPSAQSPTQMRRPGSLSPLRTDSLPLVSKMYWPENANDAIMDAP